MKGCKHRTMKSSLLKSRASVPVSERVDAETAKHNIWICCSCCIVTFMFVYSLYVAKCMQSGAIRRIQFCGA